MRVSTLLIATFNALSAVALPLVSTEAATLPATSQLTTSSGESTAYNWQKGYVSEFPIHSSCNATERRELTEALRQTVEMAEQAKNHILTHGNKSPVFIKYFGKKGATSVPMGWYAKVVAGNRDGLLFRCDDIDRNCATQDQWAGHWRGNNGTGETVICPLSYTSRLPNTAMCARGFSIATGKVTGFWAPDLLHRLFHTPQMGEEIVDHHGDGYAGSLELAASANYSLAGHNTATLQYFAAEVYAFDIAVPGEGCVGKAVVASSSSSVAAVPSATATASATSAPASGTLTSVAATRTVQAAASSAPSAAASPAGSDCHTHADGTLHCV